MAKKKRASRHRAASSKKDTRREFTRRALLAGLGLGAALPAIAGASEGGNNDAIFDAYWESVKDEIAQRDAQTVPKEKEILELRIQYKRNAVMLKIDRSSGRVCIQATPTAKVR